MQVRYGLNPSCLVMETEPATPAMRPEKGAGSQEPGIEHSFGPVGNAGLLVIGGPVSGEWRILRKTLEGTGRCRVLSAGMQALQGRAVGILSVAGPVMGLALY